MTSAPTGGGGGTSYFELASPLSGIKYDGDIRVNDVHCGHVIATATYGTLCRFPYTYRVPASYINTYFFFLIPKMNGSGRFFSYVSVAVQ